MVGVAGSRTRRIEKLMNRTAAGTPAMTSETIETLLARVSVRRFSDQPVAEETIDAVLRAALRSPTSSNIQACTVIKVRGRQAKEALAALAGNQKHVAECPVFLAFCADLTRIEAAMQRNGHDLDGNNHELGLVSTIDAALVGMSTYLAADSVGLKGVMIGAMRNDPEAVARILDLPPRVYCVFGMCLGYADAVPTQKPRMPFEAVVHAERYDRATSLGTLDAYDADLAGHYRAEGRETADASWTGEVATKFAARPRDGLRGALSRLGFDFR